MGLVKEFRDFAVKGNALDMAVGIILGAAFNKIVTSLVNDLLMPPLGMLLGGVDFKDLTILLRGARVAADGTALPPVGIRYGLFINTAIDFVIVALSVFFVVKAVNYLRTLRESKPAETPTA